MDHPSPIFEVLGCLAHFFHDASLRPTDSRFTKKELLGLAGGNTAALIMALAQFSDEELIRPLTDLTKAQDNDPVVEILPSTTHAARFHRYAEINYEEIKVRLAITRRFNRFYNDGSGIFTKYELVQMAFGNERILRTYLGERLAENRIKMLIGFDQANEDDAVVKVLSEVNYI